MQQIFKDKKLQEKFDEDGFVIIPFLSQEDITLLTTYFSDFHPTLKNNHFEASTYLNNTSEKLIIRDTLKSVFQKYLDVFFMNFTYIGSAFLYKTVGPNSDVAPHQDWTIVDEKNAVAINIWTPLIDTSEKNGTLYVVPKTHANKIYTLRAPTIPFFYQQYYKSVIRCCIPTNAKAGEAVILNQSLIHYSSPNNSDHIRLAITTGIKTENAQMIFHYKNENNEIEQYQVSEDFLSQFEHFETDIYKRPNGIKKNTVNYAPPSLSEYEFLKKFATDKFTVIDKLRLFIGRVF